MAGLLILLRDLHRAHRLIRDLREHLDRLPAQLKVHRTRLTRHEAALKEAQDALKHLKVSIHEKEGTLKDKTHQIDKYEGQMNTAGSKKEYDAFKTEIAHSKQLCAQLEDEILLAMTQTDERTAALPGLEKGAADARAELAGFEKQAKEKQDSLDDDLAKARAQLQELEVRLPLEVRDRYDLAVHGRGPDALAPLHGRACSACSTEISTQLKTNLMMDKLVICPTCARIVYLPE